MSDVKVQDLFKEIVKGLDTKQYWGSFSILDKYEFKYKVLSTEDYIYVKEAFLAKMSKSIKSNMLRFELLVLSKAIFMLNDLELPDYMPVEAKKEGDPTEQVLSLYLYEFLKKRLPDTVISHVYNDYLLLEGKYIENISSCKVQSLNDRKAEKIDEYQAPQELIDGLSKATQDGVLDEKTASILRGYADVPKPAPEK